MLSKTVHLRPLRPANVIRVRTPERAAKLHERNSMDDANFEYKPILKTSFDSNVYKFQKERLSKPPNPKEIEVLAKNSGDVREGGRDGYRSTHFADYEIHKRKKYNQQLESMSNVPVSNVVSQDAYKTLRSTSTGFDSAPSAQRGEEADRRNMYRKNFYISKPFADLNKDFKFQPLVRNAQTTSEDTPYWFQGTTKFYTQENFDLTKKMRNTQDNLPKTDIFGKLNVDYPKAEVQFVVEPPSKGQRYELNKMVVVEKRSKKDLDNKTAHVKLRWDEDTQKQSYDRFGITKKIGNGTEPFIQKIKTKESWNPMVAYKKIGEDKDVPRLKKEKDLDLKIGHPNDTYNYSKKGREDGFYADRKVISGANYQTSNFFLE